MNLLVFPKTTMLIFKQTKWRHLCLRSRTFSMATSKFLTTQIGLSVPLSVRPIGANTQENKFSIQSSTSYNSLQSNSIAKFYEGANILLTGATGFIGKVVLEKLLRSCDVEYVYVVIRPKKGLSPEQRLQNLFESPAFDNIRETTPVRFKKVKMMYGDMSQPNMALEETNKRIIVDKVNVVFHTAASIRFTDELQDIVRTNTLGTKYMAELCKDIKHLKSFVHVSTTFSDQLDVEEIIYEPEYHPDGIKTCIETLPREAIKLITPIVIGKHPNTYTYAKALSEKVIAGYSNVLPITIVRPAAVCASWKEPFPGWVDAISSFTGLAAEASQGALKTLWCNKEQIAEFIPVDITANTIIVAAWYAATHRSTKMKIYNCSSGQINPITFGEVNKVLRRYSRKYPTKHVVLYPGYIMTTNRTVHIISQILFQYIPAYMLDVYLYCTNQKPKFVRKLKWSMKIKKSGEIVATIKRIFRTKAFEGLIEAVRKAEDGRDFNIDISKENGFDWVSYLKDYHLGIRQHILKDDISSLPYARKKLNRIYWTTKALQVISASAILGLFLW